jgi:uncharacterized membrane protein YdjX (TVP38/TMEM64 family)
MVCHLEADMAWWLFVVVLIGSMPLAGAMARERNRSAKGWIVAASVVGPLAPLALLILGDAKRSAAAN